MMECRNARVPKTVYNTHFMFADGKSNIFLSEHFHLNFIPLTFTEFQGSIAKFMAIKNTVQSPKTKSCKEHSLKDKLSPEDFHSKLEFSAVVIPSSRNKEFRTASPMSSHISSDQLNKTHVFG